MKEDNIFSLGLVGGPLCGQAVTSKDGRMPNILPLPYKRKKYTYKLKINKKSKDYTEIYYQYYAEKGISNG